MASFLPGIVAHFIPRPPSTCPPLAPPPKVPEPFGPCTFEPKPELVRYNTDRWEGAPQKWKIGVCAAGAMTAPLNQGPLGPGPLTPPDPTLGDPKPQPAPPWEMNAQDVYTIGDKMFDAAVGGTAIALGTVLLPSPVGPIVGAVGGAGLIALSQWIRNRK